MKLLNKTISQDYWTNKTRCLRNDPSSFNVRPFKNNVPIVIPHDYIFASMIIEIFLLKDLTKNLNSVLDLLIYLIYIL